MEQILRQNVTPSKTLTYHKVMDIFHNSCTIYYCMSVTRITVIYADIIFIFTTEIEYEINNIALFHAAISFKTLLTNLFIPIYIISFDNRSMYVQVPTLLY